MMNSDMHHWLHSLLYRLLTELRLEFQDELPGFCGEGKQAGGVRAFADVGMHSADHLAVGILDVGFGLCVEHLRHLKAEDSHSYVDADNVVFLECLSTHRANLR